MQNYCNVQQFLKLKKNQNKIMTLFEFKVNYKNKT